MFEKEFLSLFETRPLAMKNTSLINQETMGVCQYGENKCDITWVGECFNNN